MNIRTKLVGAFLLVALLVPILGGVAVRRVDSINGEVEDLSRGAVPLLVLVNGLEQSQQEQQTAVLSFLASGRPEDRQQYEERSRRFDAETERLTKTASGAGGAGSAPIGVLAKRLVDGRTSFSAAAGQMISSRVTVDRSLAELRARSDEIVDQLNSILSRFPTPSRRPADVSTIPATLRRENSELLLSTEGMLRVVDLEFALATSYAIRQDDAIKQQFEDASLIFTEWLQAANAASSANDRAILGSVQSKFYKEFEPSARSMLLAADFSAKARGVFTEASTGILGLLDEMAAQASRNTDTARGNAERTAGSTGRQMVVLTLIAFVLAGALGAWFAGTLTRPLVHLRDVADRVSQGDLDNIEIDITTEDEVGDLARAFRRMVTSLRILMPRETDESDVPALRI
jgi:HAMP domain-containing protein